MNSERNAVQELLDAPYGHRVMRDPNTGHSHVELLLPRGRTVTAVAPTFDEAVFRALDEAKATR
jgi:phage baseplate assembly protein W